MRAVLAAAAGGVLALTLAATVPAASRPSLVVTKFAPVTVAGAGFAPGERVVVTVVAGTKKHVRPVRAGTAGRFSARFEFGAALGCGPTLRVSALGSSGSKATAKLPQVRCPRD